MPRYVALLRGINLGKRRVKMEDLRDLFVELGFKNVATLIASGNVAFETRATTSAALAKKIEAHLHARLGYEVDTFVRTHDEIKTAATHPAFAKAEMAREENTVYVIFQREPLLPDTAKHLMACRTTVDELHINGREIYWLCRVRSTDSVVWNSPGVKALKLPTNTMRNLNTVQRLAAMA